MRKFAVLCLIVIVMAKIAFFKDALHQYISFCQTENTIFFKWSFVCFIYCFVFFLYKTIENDNLSNWNIYVAYRHVSLIKKPMYSFLSYKIMESIYNRFKKWCWNITSSLIKRTFKQILYNIFVMLTNTRKVFQN